MLFKQPATGVPDHYQYYSVVVGRSERQIADDFLYRQGCLLFPKPDALLLAKGNSTKLGTILVKTGFVKSKRDLERSFKAGQIKLNNAAITADKDLDLLTPEPYIDVRKGGRFLEIVIPLGATWLEFIQFKVRRWWTKKPLLIEI